MVMEQTVNVVRDLLHRARGEADTGLPPTQTSRTLPPETMAALGLSRQPFRDHAPAEELFVDDAIEMQLNMLGENLRSGGMLPVLKGEPGSGKTSLLIQLMARANDSFHFFVVRSEPSLTAEKIIVDMLRVLVRPPPADIGECFRELARQLRTLVADGRAAVLVVDDADDLDDTDLNNLLAAHDSLRSALGGRFRLLLAAQPSIELRIANLDSEELDSGQMLASNIRPMARPRIGSYLAHRLDVAGFNGELPLGDPHLDRIAEAGSGLPGPIESAAAAELNALYAGR